MKRGIVDDLSQGPLSRFHLGHHVLSLLKHLLQFLVELGIRDEAADSPLAGRDLSDQALQFL